MIFYHRDLARLTVYVMVYDRKGLQTMDYVKWTLKNRFFMTMAPFRLYLLDCSENCSYLLK